MVIAGNPLKSLVGDRRSLDQTNRLTEFSETLTFDFHALRIVLRLPKVITQSVTENLTRPKGQHDPPPTNPNELNDAEIEPPEPRITTFTQSSKWTKSKRPRRNDRTQSSKRSPPTSIKWSIQIPDLSKSLHELKLITKNERKAEVRTPTSKRIRLEVARAPPFAPPAGGK
jgi:hypothetical protein